MLPAILESPAFRVFFPKVSLIFPSKTRVTNIVRVHSRVRVSSRVKFTSMTGRVPSMEKAPSIVKFLSIVRLPIIGRFPSKVNSIISLFSRIVVDLTLLIIVKTVNIIRSMTARSGSLRLE